MMMRLHLILYDQLRERPDLQLRIERARLMGDLTQEDIDTSLRAQERICLEIEDDGKSTGCMLLELDGDALHITTLEGDFKKGWERWLYTQMVQICEDQGQTAIQLGGRKGWRRFLKPLGFKPVGRYMRLEL